MTEGERGRPGEGRPKNGSKEPLYLRTPFHRRQAHPHFTHPPPDTLLLPRLPHHLPRVRHRRRECVWCGVGVGCVRRAPASARACPPWTLHLVASDSYRSVRVRRPRHRALLRRNVAFGLAGLSPVRRVAPLCSGRPLHHRAIVPFGVESALAGPPSFRHPSLPSASGGGGRSGTNGAYRRVRGAGDD